MIWSIVNFGRYKGKTLPQILFSDPDWFFNAVEKDFFKDALKSEAQDLLHKAKNIKIPNNEDGGQIVEYVVHQPTGKFSHFNVVSADTPEHEGSSPTFRKPVIDMSVCRSRADYDKWGNKLLIGCIKDYIFGNKDIVLTKKRCGEFFDDPTNFSITKASPRTRKGFFR